jgi:hypothetical protein
VLSDLACAVSERPVTEPQGISLRRSRNTGDHLLARFDQDRARF